MSLVSCCSCLVLTSFTFFSRLADPSATPGPRGVSPRLYKDAVDMLQQVLEEKRVEQMARHQWLTKERDGTDGRSILA